MKTMILPVFFALALMSCSSSPKEDGEELCAMRKAHKAAIEAGDRDEVARIEEEGEKLERKMEEKYRNDEAGRKEMKAAMRACRGQAGRQPKRAIV